MGEKRYLVSSEWRRDVFSRRRGKKVIQSSGKERKKRAAGNLLPVEHEAVS